MTHVILLGIVGLIGGTFGSMVGLGGGVFIIPALTLFLGVPIHSAISASLIAVVATSTTAAAAYVREDLSNMRLGMTMETMTVSGALVGGFIGASLSKGVLSAVFGSVMVVVSIYMVAGKQAVHAPAAHEEDLGLLGHSYFDRNLQTVVAYRSTDCRSEWRSRGSPGPSQVCSAWGADFSRSLSWCWRCVSRSGPRFRRAAS
jgi:uncharacterized membrane protein YfcA